MFFFFLNLETWLLRGLLFLARVRREASWGLRGTKAGGGWRIIISFPCLFNGIFILFFYSSVLYLCTIVFISMPFQKILSLSGGDHVLNTNGDFGKNSVLNIVA